MKKHLLLTAFFTMLAIVSWSQLPVFNNASEDNNLYSNTGNWADGIKPSNNGQAQFNGRAELDEAVTLSYLRASVMNAGLLNGSGTLTLTGGSGSFVDLQQFTTGDLLLDVPIIYTATDPAGQNLFRVDADGGFISFGPNSDLDLSSANPVRLQGFPGAAAFANFNFDGILRGSSNMQLGINVNTVFFGATSDNSNYTGQIIFFSPGSTIIANNEGGNLLVAPDNKIQVNNNNGTLALNGKDNYHGFLQLDGANTLLWQINADQPNIQRLDIPGSGTINLELGSEVDSVHFSHSLANGDLSASTWAAGASLVINNFVNAALRFGADATGLTPTQLSQIDIGGNAVSLNGNGFLVDPTLNTAPMGGTIDDLNLTNGFGTREIDVSALFSDPQNDNFNIEASSSESFVTVDLSEETLTITESSNGVSTITITATDEFGAQASVNFNVTVGDAPDADGDGVPDSDDVCPNTPNGEAVDGDGCSDSQKDTDNDGITDDLDLCPNTASGATVDSDGCADAQKDTDNDGITDDLDLCANTPAGATVDSDGCADSQKDTDNDGVADDLDLCAETPSGATVDGDGCADSQKDTDGDGVTDDLDQCPGTENGANVDAIGCIVLSNELANENVYVYPNPVQDYIRIKNLNRWVDGTLEIHDMSGRMILRNEVDGNQDQISIETLEVGRYILNLEKDGKKEVLNFIKIN